MMSSAKLWSACALAAAVVLAACASEPQGATNVRQIVSTTSFGMCVGYCTTRLELSEGQAVLIRLARGGRGTSDLPDQRTAVALSASEWQEIARLAAGTNLYGLPPVIGCPDCADGGAESLTITGATTQTISFEHGATIPQAQSLLDRVRALRARMLPAE